MKQHRGQFFFSSKNRKPYTFEAFHIEKKKLRLKKFKAPARTSLLFNLFVNGDSMFLCPQDGGVYKVRPQRTLQPVYEQIVRDSIVHALAFSADSSIWLAFTDRLVNVRKGNILKTIPLPSRENVKRLKITDRGKLIFSTFSRKGSGSGTLFYLDPENGKVINLSEAIRMDGPVTECMISDQQSLWIPTHGDGLYILPLSQLDNIRHIPSKFINAILQRSEDTFLVSGLEGIKELTPSGMRKLNDVNSLLFPDSEPLIYSVFSSGAYFISGRLVAGFPINTIAMLGDSILVVGNGTIGYCSTENGLIDKGFSYRGMNITDAYALENKKVLLATDLGLRFLDASPSVPQAISDSIPAAFEALKNLSIYSFEKSSDGSFWISTDLGLFKFSKGRLTHLASRKDLPFWGRAVMKEDPYGTLWIGTQKGLIRYDGESFLGIEQRHGLLSSEINAVYYSTQDELWLGTSKGISIIEQANRAETFEYEQAVFELSAFSVGEDRMINQGEALSFQLLPKDPLYYELAKTQYKLDEGNWLWFEGRKDIENLTSGEHELQLRGRLSHTDWYALEPMVFNVRPWWQNLLWLSIILGLLLLGFLIGTYFKNRLEREKRYSQRLQTEITERERAEAALSKIRQDIARDYHDELGNHLASITVLSSMAKKKYLTKQEDIPKVLDKISKSSKQLHVITKDFLWSIEGKWHYLDELIVYLADKGNAFFEPLGIDFECPLVTEKEAHIKLPISVGRNVLLIFKEAMTNVGKYAEAKHVKLELEHHPDRWVLSLSNDGKIVDLKEKENSRGLGNMKVRAQKIGADLLLRSELTRLTYNYSSKND